MAKRLDAISKPARQDLSPKTWYGMPAYAGWQNRVLLSKPAQKFQHGGTRRSGFNDAANLDEGGMWPVAFALKE